MKRAEVAIIATPTMGNLLPTIEFATHITNHHYHISITILIISIPQWPLIHNYVQSLTPTDHIRFIHLPPPDTPPPTHYDSLIEYLSLYIQYHKPVVQQILENQPVPLAGFFIDMFCTSMIDVANDLNIPCYLYFASPAAYLAFVLHLTTLPVTESTDSLNEEVEEKRLAVPGLINLVPSTAFPLFCINKKELGYSCFVRHALRYKATKGIVVNTFLELEPYALDSLSNNNIGCPPVYPVGPVVDHVGPVKWHPNQSMHEKTIKWLDQQPDSSVVFLCFGSMGSLNRIQVREIATGLERTGYRFLWSLREPGKTEIELPNDYEKLEDLFPDGFIDRTAHIGLVCGWVSQVSVLAHKAVGGFVSHCGWNSILESIWYGVPIATWPLYGEQHLNAFEMVKEVGLSVEIRLGKEGDLVLADEVERGVRELMDDEDGELRKKVKEMSETSKTVLMENGSSFQALENLICILLSNV